MKKIPFILLLLISLSSKAYIDLWVDSPTPNQMINSNNTIYAAGVIYVSTYHIASIVSNTNGRIDTLPFTVPINFPLDPITFGKQLDTTGLPTGVPVQMIITATDVMGNQVSDTLTFTRVLPPPAPPKAFIILPTTGTNGYPSLHIKTSHTGTDTCTSYLSMHSGANTLIEDTSVFNDYDTIINFNGTVTGNMTLRLTVKDKWNQSSSQATVDIFIDNNMFLSLVYEGAGLIKDYNYHRILDATNAAVYMLSDSNTQVRQALPNSTNVNIASYTASPRLTPMGAVWRAYDSNANSLGTWELNNDSLYSNVPFSAVAGVYTYYSVPFTISATTFGRDYYLWNMQTRTAESMGRFYLYSNDALPGFSIAANGGVAILGVDGVGVSTFKTGGGSLGCGISISNTGYTQFFGVTTDGKNVLFKGRDSGPGANDHLLWCNGTTTTSLGIIGSILSTSSPSYMAVNNFIAYPKSGISGEFQVWLKDSAGADRQISPTGFDYSVTALSPHGDIIYSGYDAAARAYKSFYVKYDSSTPRALGTLVGSPIYRDGSWYIINGRYLYRLNVGANITVASGNWTDAASWENNTVPPPGADVIVNTNITVNTNVVCNSLHVVPPGNITVAPGATLTVLH